MVHRLQLILCPITLIERHRVRIGFHLFHMAGHQELHKVPRLAIAVFALHNHFVDIPIVDIANGALDQVTVLIDERGRLTFERGIPNLIPKPGEIIKIAFDFGLGPLKAGRPNDAAHAGRQVQFRHDRLQPLAICRV